MTEETVTKTILGWLIEGHWKIICYDFPQSGTGRVLHPNESNEKNKDSIIPDIVAVRDNTCVFFENKSFFYYPDFEKVNSLIKEDTYSEAINKLLASYSINNIYYGVGFPSEAYTKKAEKALSLVDFLIVVDEDESIRIIKAPESLLL